MNAGRIFHEKEQKKFNNRLSKVLKNTNTYIPKQYEYLNNSIEEENSQNVSKVIMNGKENVSFCISKIHNNIPSKVNTQSTWKTNTSQIMKYSSIIFNKK